MKCKESKEELESKGLPLSSGTHSIRPFLQRLKKKTHRNIHSQYTYEEFRCKSL